MPEIIVPVSPRVWFAVRAILLVPSKICSKLFSWLPEFSSDL